MLKVKQRKHWRTEVAAAGLLGVGAVGTAAAILNARKKPAAPASPPAPPTDYHTANEPSPSTEYHTAPSEQEVVTIATQAHNAEIAINRAAQQERLDASAASVRGLNELATPIAPFATQWSDTGFKVLVDTKVMYDKIRHAAFNTLDFLLGRIEKDAMDVRQNRLCLLDILYQCATPDVKPAVFADILADLPIAIAAPALDVGLCDAGRQVQYLGYRLVVCVAIMSVIFEHYGISFQHDFYTLPCITAGDPMELATRLIIERSLQYETIVFTLGQLATVTPDKLVTAFIATLEKMKVMSDPIHQRLFVTNEDDILFLVHMANLSNTRLIRDNGFQGRFEHDRPGLAGYKNSATERHFYNQPGVYFNIITRKNRKVKLPYVNSFNGAEGQVRFIVSKTVLFRRDWTINIADNNGIITTRTYTPDNLDELPLASEFIEVVFHHAVPFAVRGGRVAEAWVTHRDLACVKTLLPGLTVRAKYAVGSDAVPIMITVDDPISNADNIANYCYVDTNTDRNYDSTVVVKQLAHNCNVPEEEIAAAKDAGTLAKLVTSKYLEPYYKTHHRFPVNRFTEYIPPHFMDNRDFISFEYYLRNSGVLRGLVVLLDQKQVDQLLYTQYFGSHYDDIRIDDMRDLAYKYMHYWVVFSPQILLDHDFHVTYRLLHDTPPYKMYDKDAFAATYMHEVETFGRHGENRITFRGEAFNMVPYLVGAVSTEIEKGNYQRVIEVLEK